MDSEKNREVVLVERPGRDGEPEDIHFGVRECAMPLGNLLEGHVLIRTCYLSVDPALRCLMNEDSGVDYMSSWKPGERILGSSGVGVVVNSKHPDYKAGDLLETIMGWPWVTYFIHDMKDVEPESTEHRERVFQKLDKWSLFGAKPSLALSVLVGLTALIGLWERGHVNVSANQTLVVSGAAGATGSFAGQMGKLLGCRNVVGLCGTSEKCAWLTDTLGFSGAINYKTDNIHEKLKSLCHNGVDIYFDNVGGAISEMVINQMNHDSHVILCGQISQYNKDVPYPPPVSQHVADRLQNMNITRERFLVLQYKHRYSEALQCLVNWIMSGELKYKETVTEGLENAGKAFVSMMCGGNMGKQIVHVSDHSL